MKELFSMDQHNYDPEGKVTSRPSARGIVIKDEKVLLVHSRKYDYYKFPGGGIENGEDAKTALCREVLEETGFHVIPDSIEEFGCVPRRHRDQYDENGIFEQINYYYFCKIEDGREETNLDAYEAEEGFEAVWMDPFRASHHNRYRVGAGEKEGFDDIMIKRESKVLDLVDLECRRIGRAERMEQTLQDLGHPEFKEMLSYVRGRLEKAETESSNGPKMEIYYSRADHTKRVLAWVLRLYNMAEDKEKIRFEDLVIATIFHDVGRENALAGAVPHALAGVPITEAYLKEKGYPEERIKYICSLVAGHSDKHRMGEPDLDRGLLMLMEADLMDDMGAAGIVMDCMITESRNPKASFEDCLDHMTRYTLRIQEEDNPMSTPAARKIWDEKTRLVRDFVTAYRRDLELAYL